MKNEKTTEGRTLKKWYTEIQYVDIETGEIIDKKVFTEKYYKTNQTRKIEIYENYGIIKYITECRNRNQTKLFS
jgi:hypothetical protein